ncbi:hypothetical protein OIDMADRAFT_61926 [Oidiodendron maius Zn]|uniref:Uncharacterized protein n=1 Tax=Oidiodendron maius (strain Zn) TaxID=913774 RepID=A0A0C3GP22_OIDMZ|nr:hypothetical protein OIDMADRAFT_61926 [Oidiodendron maius Zn]
MAVASDIFIPLATPDTFDHDFDNAENAYLSGEMIVSANRFLKVWRVTRGELERQLHTPLESQLATLYTKGEHPGLYDSVVESLQFKRQKLTSISLCALHNLALACYCSIGKEYRDDEGKCVLDVCTPQSGCTAVEEIEIDDEASTPNSDIASILKLRDALGNLLNSTNSFRGAACIVAHYCYMQACGGKQFRGLLSIQANMPWVIVLTCEDIPWVEKWGKLILKYAGEESIECGSTRWIHKSYKQAEESGILSVSLVKSSQ